MSSVFFLRPQVWYDLSIYGVNRLAGGHFLHVQRKCKRNFICVDGLSLSEVVYGKTLKDAILYEGCFFVWKPFQ